MVLFVGVLGACATTNCPLCPSETVIIFAPPYGNPVTIPEGFLDDLEKVMTMEEWEQFQKDMKKFLENYSDKGEVL